MNDLHATVSPLAELSVFFGAASDAEASVYAQLAGSEYCAADVQLSGRVTGPISKYAHTLQASVALSDLGPGATRLAEARVPDPCFWTPDAPYVYEVKVEVRRGAKLLATEQRTLAIRRLGFAGRSLFLDAKRWVPRAAVFDASKQPSISHFRDASLGLVIDDAAEDTCYRATREGVLLAVRIGSHVTDVAQAVRKLGRHGAVGLVIVDNPRTSVEIMKSAARNVILCECRCDAEPSPPSEWAESIVYEVHNIARAAEFVRRCKLPVIAMRRAAETVDPVAARAACDALQRDLASLGDFAGYFV